MTSRTYMYVRYVVLLSVFAAFLTACSSQKKAAGPASGKEAAERQAVVHQAEDIGVEKPTRVILLIGDGMGVPALTASSYAKGSPLAMLEMDSMGWMTTHSHEFVTTDSAASATALATGHKTHFEGVSVAAGTSKDTEGDEARHLETVLEKAERVGWKTGLVSTSRIVHATPAAFASHRAHRRSYEDIAYDLYESGVDVLLGGGTRYFRQRGDEVDLLEGFEDNGYTVAESREEIREASKRVDRLIGLPHDPDFPAAGDPDRVMSLGEMTEDALQVLDRDNEEGFFLMVEGSQIDWRGHDLDGEGVVKETLDFDGAVAAARAYARERDDTVVVVTSDHETGGMAVLDSPYVKDFSEAFGGHDKMWELTSSPEQAADDPASPPVASIARGQSSEGNTFGPPYAVDDHLEAVFGHLSVASRPLCEVPREFSGMHTPALVPVFSEGKAAEFIAESDDNAELGRRLKKLIGTGRAAAPNSPQPNDGGASAKPQNLIVMIGDGMGIGALTAAHYASGSLSMRALPVKGIASTHSADRLVADSAAAATAIASGRRTNNGVVGMARTADGLERAESLLEKAEAQGMQTGLVTTTPLTHATPAAFYAHHETRSDKEAIADFFVNMPRRVPGSDGIDVAFGAGRQVFDSERREQLEQRGVVIEERWTDRAPKHGQIVRLLGDEGLQSASERRGDGASSTPTLRQMTQTALERLSASDDGFVLVVEGGQIDWSQHSLARDQSLVDEVVDFDEAVAEAHEFARRDEDTLLVVTADHDHTTSVIDNHYQFDNCSCAAAAECGGDFELTRLPAAVDDIEHNEGLSDASLQGTYSPLEISIQYAWLVQEGAPKAGRPGTHSANFVPVFADGPYADKLGGFSDLTDLGQRLHEALDD